MKGLMSAADCEVLHFRLIDKTMTQWCPGCRVDRAIKLPAHPAGFGTCLTCGWRMDLSEYDDRRGYYDHYEKIRTGITYGELAEREN